MTEDSLTRWARAVESYLTARANVDAVEADSTSEDHQMVDALDRLHPALAAIIDTPAPSLMSFYTKLRYVEEALDLDALAPLVLPSITRDFGLLLGVDSAI